MANQLLPPDPAYKQYRFSIGSPDLEARFQKALQAAQAQDVHTRNYPVLYVCLVEALNTRQALIRLEYRLFMDRRCEIGIQCVIV
jgi:hypothetical protein